MGIKQESVMGTSGRRGCRWIMLPALVSAGIGAVAAPSGRPGGGAELRAPSAEMFARFLQSLPTGDSHSIVFATRSANRMRAEPAPPLAALDGSTAALVPPGASLIATVAAGTPLRDGALLLFQHRQTGHGPFTIRWVSSGNEAESRTCARIGAASWRTVAMELAPREDSRGTVEIALADGTSDMDETLAISGVAVAAVSAEEREQWHRMRQSLAETGALLDALNCRRQSVEILVGQVRRAEALGLPLHADATAGAWKECSARLNGLEQRYDALHQLEGPLLLQGKTEDWTAYMGLLVRDTARLEGSLVALKTRLLATLARAGARPPVVAARATGLPYLTPDPAPPAPPAGVAFDTRAAESPGPPRWAVELWPDRPLDATACRALRARLWRRFAEGAEGVTLRGSATAPAAAGGLYDPRYGEDRLCPAAVTACAARDEARRLWTYFATTTPIALGTGETGIGSEAHELFVQERRAVSGRLLILVNQNPARAVTTTVASLGRYQRATDLGIGPGARLRVVSDPDGTRSPCRWDRERRR